MRKFVAFCLVGLTLTACSSPSTGAPINAPAASALPSARPSSGPASAPADGATSAPADDVASDSGKLTLDIVKREVEPLFAKDPDCPKGEWVTDVGNLDAQYRAGVKQFAEYDCHLAAGEAVPHRVAQAIFITFPDPKAANAYADGELGMVPSLMSYSTVVVIGSGLSTVNVRQTLRDISKACACGNVS